MCGKSCIPLYDTWFRTMWNHVHTHTHNLSSITHTHTPANWIVVECIAPCNGIQPIVTCSTARSVEWRCEEHQRCEWKTLGLDRPVPSSAAPPQRRHVHSGGHMTYNEFVASRLHAPECMVSRDTFVALLVLLHAASRGRAPERQHGGDDDVGMSFVGFSTCPCSVRCSLSLSMLLPERKLGL